MYSNKKLKCNIDICKMNIEFSMEQKSILSNLFFKYLLFKGNNKNTQI